MTKLEFSENKKISIGVEIEIQLIDPISGDLKPVGPHILQAIVSQKDARYIKSELFQSMLEIETPISENASEIGQSLRKSLNLTRKYASYFDSQIIMSGTHPFAHYSERFLTPSSRYYSLVDRNQWIARRLQIFGLHIHLGMRNGEHAIAMNNALCHYLPILLAISASSPFWHGADTGLASSRITFFEAIPTGGHPYLLNSWNDFENLVEKLIFSNSITSIKDLWWDIRPNLEYGTIEIRIADCPPTIKEVEAIVALAHTLALFIDEELSAGRRFPPPPEWILRENKWRASRHGVQCDLIRDPEGHSAPFQDIWQELKDVLKPMSHRYGYESFFEFMDTLITKGPSYLRQKRKYSNSFDPVIQHLIRENQSDQPEWDD